MSGSSRSIAAARQKRSGEKPSNFAQQPNYSQQPNFAQQQPSKNLQQQKQFQNSTQNSNQKATTVQPPQRPKLSVSDAFGLVTLRLGRVEQFIQQISENGELKSDLSNMSSLPENSQLIDKGVFVNMISRLDGLEKKDNSNISKQISSLELELRTTKDLLISFMAKFEKFSKETDEKFTDFETAIEEIEKNIVVNSEDEGEPISNDLNSEIINNEEDDDNVEGVTFEISEN
jgi:hypothetical protein